ncbi:MAG TPA: pitrilysin family protein, partial [Kiloniellales bacterium]|nr:pitrilysin family protein [Kiloniellales bacterium]
MSVAVTRLDNGLTVASDSMHEVASVSLGVFVDVGTRHETPQANGVAHLLEHMAFKGTRRRSARAIAEEIEAVGGHLNAYTGREGTAYYAKLLADDAGLAIDILADILQDSVYDPEELARERQVVLQEIGLAEDTPDDIVFDLYQETAFPDQPLGRPVLGRAEIVSRLGREALIDYQDENYGADRMVLAAAGRIEHDWLVERAHSLFSALSGRGEAVPQPARYAGGELIEARELEQVHLVLGFPGVAARDPRIYTAAVLSTLLGGGMSSRLFQEVREKRGLVYSIYTFVSHFKDGGLFSLYAGTGESEAAEVMPVVAAELVKAIDHVAPEEVERAAAQVRATLLMARESTGARAEALAAQLSTFGRPLSTEEILAEIAAVDT